MARRFTYHAITIGRDAVEQHDASQLFQTRDQVAIWRAFL